VLEINSSAGLDLELMRLRSLELSTQEIFARTNGGEEELAIFIGFGSYRFELGRDGREGHDRVTNRIGAIVAYRSGDSSAVGSALPENRRAAQGDANQKPKHWMVPKVGVEPT